MASGGESSKPMFYTSLLPLRSTHYIISAIQIFRNSHMFSVIYSL